MSLSDPTGGAGYSFGQVLPSSHMTTIAKQQVRALDVVQGGSYLLNADVTVQDDGAGRWFNEVPFNFHTHQPTVTGMTADRYQPLIKHAENALWTAETDGHIWQSTTTASPPLLIVLTEMIDASTLTALRIEMDGDMHGGGVHSAFPANMPVLTLYKTNNTNTLTTVATHTLDATADFASTIGNYDATWSYTFSGPSAGVDKSVNGTYLLGINGEAGLNSQTGLTLLTIRGTFTPTKLSLG